MFYGAIQKIKVARFLWTTVYFIGFLSVVNRGGRTMCRTWLELSMAFIKEFIVNASNTQHVI